ncbi:MAG: TadE/TadG family type IV pilus assembly protein [Candidatus Dormibacteria bacterium]
MNRRRRTQEAQAVVETALVLPILLALVSVFVGLMIEVQLQQEMQSATALAAESYFQSPRHSVDPRGTTCCGAGATALDTSGLPKGCRFAAESFYGTMQAPPYLDAGAGGALCTRDGLVMGHATTSMVTCETQALERALNPPLGERVVRCTARATIRFSRTPLAWAMLFDPTIAATAEAVPPPFRQ